MKLADATDRFTRQLAANGRSHHTRAAYRRDLEALAKWLGNKPDLGHITPDVPARFLCSVAVLRTPDGKLRAALTVNRTKSALRSFFAFCVESGWIKDNPARLIRSSPAAAKEPTTLTEDEIGRLRTTLAEADGPCAIRDSLIFEVLLGTGIRLGLLVGLNVGDVDLTAGIFHIRGRGGTRERVFLNPGWCGCWAGSCVKTSVRATEGRTSPCFAANPAPPQRVSVASAPGRCNCSLPPSVMRPT